MKNCIRKGVQVYQHLKRHVLEAKRLLASHQEHCTALPLGGQDLSDNFRKGLRCFEQGEPFSLQKKGGIILTTTAFYQLPKPLFTEEKYQVLSSDAKMLYALMRDRFKLSLKNHWRDSIGVYIKMTRVNICALLKRSEPTVRKIIAELKKVGLLIEKRMGLTQANKIYVQLLDGECETDFQPKEKVVCVPEHKQGFAPDRNGFSRSKTNSKHIHFRKLTSKPDIPQNGDIWEDNGQLWTYHHGYTQRYHAPGELKQLCFDPFAVMTSV